MTAHLHAEFVPGCFRCDLSQDEVSNAEHAAAVAAAGPRCRCGHNRNGHGRSNHSVHATGCWSPACGCRYFRPRGEEQ